MEQIMKQMTVEAFVAETAAGTATPGGGSISALAGSLGAALSQMVAGLTTGKKKYADVESEMQQVIEKMRPLAVYLLDAVERDSRSFDQFMQALTLPKETQEEQAARKAAMQEGLKAAVMAPLDVARTCMQIFPCAQCVVEKGNRTAVTDGLVSALMTRTAVLGSVANIRVNLLSIEDEAFTGKIRTEADALEEEAERMERIIREAAATKLR